MLGAVKGKSRKVTAKESFWFRATPNFLFGEGHE
jgi:hypothetical protein